jgi:hypothetical protein
VHAALLRARTRDPSNDRERLMHSRIQASCAAVGAMRDEPRRYLFAAVVLSALALAGCQPATVPVVATDPADPSAPVRGVHYRSTTAPYTSMRPAIPAPWRERNDTDAPQGKGGGR